MNNKSLVLLVPFLLTAFVQTGIAQKMDLISYIKYSWKAPAEKSGNNMLSTTLFQGSAHDFEYLRMEASSLKQSKNWSVLQVPSNEEHLFIIKSGTMTISFGDSTWSIGPASIALLMPGEKISLRNDHDSPCLFYQMKYRSKAPADLARAESGGGSIVRDWNKLSFNAHDRGGVRRYFEKGTAMCKRFEMHVTTLKKGLKSHDAHTHRAEEIVLVLEDATASKSRTEMQIGDNFFQGAAGDIYFLGSNVLHGIRNAGNEPCNYFAFQFE